MIELSGLCAFFVLCVVGTVGAFVVSPHHNPILLAVIAAAAALILGFVGAVALLGHHSFMLDLWQLPADGILRIGIDPLSALFLLITAAVYLPTSIFSAGYLRRYEDHYSLRSFTVLYFSLFVSIVAVLLARDVLSFLLAWELMSIASFLLVNFEFESQRTIRAGYIMLSMGEAGALAAAIAFLLLANDAGSLGFSAIKAAAGGAGTGIRWAVFLLSLFGFGVKAGLVPFNSWLPRAHPAAPANVSALLSGVILNLGIYGIVRINVDLLPVSLPGTGVVALIVGAASALLGILFATVENDSKSMLAHSSIENMGIVTTALGAGFAFTAAAKPALAVIAFVAALYHLINHSIYKALLFLGAGTVDARAGTRDLDRLGGLIHKMPWTAAAFLVGSLSIAAVYPFNGFASEWLTLQALLRSAELSSNSEKLVFAGAGVVLAVTAGLAVTCFVKAFAMGFLGIARSPEAAHACEAPRTMVAPMGALAILCVLLGVTPTYIIPAIGGALAPLVRADATRELVPAFFVNHPDHPQLPAAFAEEFRDLGANTGESLIPGRGQVVLHQGGASNPVVFAMSTTYGFVVLMGLVVATACVLRWSTRSRRLRRAARWDGGVRHLFPEMTYTATGFSNPVRVVFEAIIRPRTVEDTEETVVEHFRVAIRRSQEPSHLVDRFARMLSAIMMGVARLLARMHHGRVNAYVSYVLVTLVIFLALSAAFA